MINEYIADVCDLLDMDIPTISHDDSHFPTNTTMALCNPAAHTIYLRKENSVNIFTHCFYMIKSFVDFFTCFHSIISYLCSIYTYKYRRN